MRFVRSFISALSMFTAIPMPQYEWDMEHGSRMTAFLGLVGCVLGALWLCARLLLSLIPLPAPAAAVLLVAAAQLLTGFLHLDGFMDVCDALLSHRDEEGRRAILKDPHCGSFAVVSLVLLLALQFAAVYALLGREIALPRTAAAVVALPALSRSSAGMLLLTVRTLPGSSLGAYFKTGNRRGALCALALTLLAALTAVFLWCGAAALICLMASLLAAALSGLYAVRRLGGVNGDTAGFVIVLGETLMLLSLTLL